MSKSWLMATVVTLAHCACGYVALRHETPLPPDGWADTVSSTNMPCASWKWDTRNFQLEMDFDATPSNAVEVAWGKDADGDGKLGLDETGFAVAWDCGHWRLWGRNGTNELLSVLCESVEAAETAAGRKCFRMDVGVWMEKPKGMAATENGAAVFGQYLKRSEEWFYRSDWDVARISTCGMGNAAERVQLKLRTVGIVVIFR